MYRKNIFQYPRQIIGTTDIEVPISEENSAMEKPGVTKIIHTDPNTKRKMTHEDLITSAQKLGRISIENAKNNLSEKTIITKFMLDNINKYGLLVEANIGKQHKKSFKTLSKFGKPNKILTFTVEKAFEHILLCVLFLSQGS